MTNQYNSVYAAIVADNKDPKKIGRVKLQVPAISEDFTTEWAFPASMFSGEDSGFFNPPPIDGGCWVMFLEGDPETAVYLGGFWAAPDGKSEVPEEFQRKDCTNRGLKTPKGHLLEFDDAEDSQGIRLTTIDGFKFLISDSDGKIILESPSGVKVELDDKGNSLKLNGGKLSFSSTEKMSLESSQDISINAGAKSTIEATGKAAMKGTAGTELGSSSSMTDINGVMVNLAGGGAPIARMGDTAIGVGFAGVPVISNIISGSPKVTSA